jgi:hypothetical protein
MIIGGAALDSGIDTGDIPASLRFRGGQHLSRTFGTPTSNTTWSYSTFCKRGALGSGFQWLLGGAASTNGAIYLSSDTLVFWKSTAAVASSTAVFRDPTGHGHLFIVSNGTTIVAYWNNLQILSYTGTMTGINAASALHTIGKNSSASTEYFDGYLSRVCFVDGSALTPSSFGYQNTEINEWVSKSQSAVKAVVDAGGTNSFMLDFDNATSLTTLGYDKSSKGNNWTLNNFSLTAGTTYDWMLDVPGNSYATLNPLVNTQGYGLSLGNSNLYAYAGTGSNIYLGAKATPIPSNGQWYWECRVDSKDAAAGDWVQCGVIPSSANWPASNLRASQWGTACQYFNTGGKEVAGSSGAYGASYGFGDVIGVALDTIAGTVTFYKNGVSQGTAMSGFAGFFDFSPCVEAFRSTGTNNAWTLNFGQQPWAYAPPSGYKALCQRNMPDPAILNPEKHFDVLLHSGNTSTQNVTGAQFQPDLAWIKSRNTNYWNFLYDSVRGATKALVSNSTNAEATYAAGLTGFLSNGISLGNQLDVNGSTYTYVDWLWKAGGTAVTNNAGTVSAQVSANVNAGFSIATFASPAAGDFSIGHGLSKAPGLVIAKATNGNTFNWAVFHVGVCTNGQFLRLNTTDAKQTPGGNVWGAAIPSATLVNLTATGAVEASKNCVVYSFAEIPGFSKIFSYTGNGSADGPFVHCGFKPKFVLVKRADSTGNWVLLDTARNTVNPSPYVLFPNLTNAEGGYANGFDTLSTGFKVREPANSDINLNGATYIGIAFADVPGKYALAR